MSNWRKRVRAEGRAGWGLGVSTAALMTALVVWQQAPALLADYHTGVGERRVITLADGTRVTLNSASALDVAFDEHERQPHTLRALAEREQYLSGVRVEFLEPLGMKGVTS